MEALLASSIPDFITEYAILEATFLGQERSTDGGLLVRLELVGYLAGVCVEGSDGRLR